jgi:hypothetical protein
MTGTEKTEETKALANGIAEGAQLSEDESEQIVGGAFNQDAIARYGLYLLTGHSGTQGLIASVPTARGTHDTRVISEDALRHYASMPGCSVAVRTTSGAMRVLSSSELNELFS